MLMVGFYVCVSAAWTPGGFVDADVRRGARAEPGGGGAVKRDMRTNGSVFWIDVLSDLCSHPTHVLMYRFDIIYKVCSLIKTITIIHCDYFLK